MVKKEADTLLNTSLNNCTNVFTLEKFSHTIKLFDVDVIVLTFQKSSTEIFKFRGIVGDRLENLHVKTKKTRNK